MNAPAIDSNIQGEIPDLHAKRVVTEMLEFLTNMSRELTPRLIHAMNQPIGGNPQSQHKFVDRVRNTRSPGIIDIAAYFGKRCKFGMAVSLWDADIGGGAVIHHYLASANGPGTESRKHGPLLRIANHALIRLVQRSGATDAFKLLTAMRLMAGPVMEAMASASLTSGDGKVIYVKFKGGTAILEWPKISDLALVKTILSPDMAHPLPGLH